MMAVIQFMEVIQSQSLCQSQIILFLKLMQQCKVNDTTCVQYEKIQKSICEFTFLLYNKTAQIREREGHSSK